MAKKTKYFSEVTARLCLREEPSLYQNCSCKTQEDAVTFVRSFLADLPQEWIVVVNCNCHNRPLNYTVASVGTDVGTICDPSCIFRTAMLSGARSILMFHNHPSGDLSPSKEDVTVTKRIGLAGQIIGIRLLDHIIVSNSGYYSFYDQRPDLFTNMDIDRMVDSIK